MSSSNNTFGLPESDIKKIHDVFKKYPSVTRVVIYGSRVKGNYRPASDIDLTIIDNLNWQTFTAIESSLDELFIPYQIDLSIFCHIDNASLVEHIQRVGRDFYIAMSTRG